MIISFYLYHLMSLILILVKIFFVNLVHVYLARYLQLLLFHILCNKHTIMA